MFGSNRPQQQSDDRPVLIDGRTGRIIDTDRDTDTRDTGRGQGQQERGSAQFIYGDDGRPVPYRDGDEW